MTSFAEALKHTPLYEKDKNEREILQLRAMDLFVKQLFCTTMAVLLHYLILTRILINTT